MNIALWVLQILFAALFMLHAVPHLLPSPRLKGILAEQNIPVKRTIATWAEVVASLGLILPWIQRPDWHIRRLCIRLGLVELPRDAAGPHTDGKI
jgi:hypothetical protein